MRAITKADAAGAKVILAGRPTTGQHRTRRHVLDVLQERHGAAELHKVWRMKGVNQQAFNAMHRGDFRAALETSISGAIHWNADARGFRAALVAQWAKDSAAEPDKTRFVFAYTNAEVHELNVAIRAGPQRARRAWRGSRLPTATGPQNFAAGDRVEFTGNAATKAREGRRTL